MTVLSEVGVEVITKFLRNHEGKSRVLFVADPQKLLALVQTAEDHAMVQITDQAWHHAVVNYKMLYNGNSPFCIYFVIYFSLNYHTP